MGAQVYNQMIQRVHQSPAPPRIQASMRPKPGRINRAKANLFGKVESASLKQYVDQHIKEHMEAKSKKWGFNFQTEQPLENGQFEWERVQRTVPVAPPAMITLTQAAHVVPSAAGSSLRRGHSLRRSHSNSSSSTSSSSMSRDLTMEELMDERADRANGRGLGVEEPLDDSLSSSTSTLSPVAPASPASEETELIVTYPTLEDRDRIISTLRRETKRVAVPASPPRLRQRQITEFLKERKRLSSSSVERITVKKVRLMGGPSTSSSTVTSADGASTSASTN